MLPKINCLLCSVFLHTRLLCFCIINFLEFILAEFLVSADPNQTHFSSLHVKEDTVVSAITSSNSQTRLAKSETKTLIKIRTFVFLTGLCSILLIFCLGYVLRENIFPVS
ncbi:hypothetical protein HS088_TW15G01261 [Tripterygium wilfordii]|uniref:Uncharacterized protein n=1 Tax=Tripterygium wilfordii TaxID=458696 RepID=A0A7J7CNT3_TRIWF|nr:hypothetical protein HS088_TW15G01261 [Tripterygium wilfordii]